MGPTLPLGPRGPGGHNREANLSKRRMGHRGSAPSAWATCLGQKDTWPTSSQAERAVVTQTPTAATLGLAPHWPTRTSRSLLNVASLVFDVTRAPQPLRAIAIGYVVCEGVEGGTLFTWLIASSELDSTSSLLTCAEPDSSSSTSLCSHKVLKSTHTNVAKMQALTTAPLKAFPANSINSW